MVRDEDKTLTKRDGSTGSEGLVLRCSDRGGWLEMKTKDSRSGRDQRGSFSDFLLANGSRTGFDVAN